MEKTQLFYPERNFGGLLPEYSAFATSPVVVLPIPYDGTTEWQIGSRRGPQAIIDASQNLELYDFELGRDISQIGICTLPEVEPVMSGVEPMIERVYQIATELLDKDKFIVTLGGEHSLTLGIVRALVAKFPRLSVLQLDAHGDLRDQYLGTKYSYASVMRRIIELCPIVPLGIRSLSLEEDGFLKERGIKPFYARGLTLDEAPKCISPWTWTSSTPPSCRQ
ncbi:MAG: agmatinase [Dehalococcoidales bacterium]|nr:agmatinase [Dehalococcoidales bacterium]